MAINRSTKKASDSRLFKACLWICMISLVLVIAGITIAIALTSSLPEKSPGDDSSGFLAIAIMGMLGLFILWTGIISVPAAIYSVAYKRRHGINKHDHRLLVAASNLILIIFGSLLALVCIYLIFAFPWTFAVAAVLYVSYMVFRRIHT